MTKLFFRPGCRAVGAVCLMLLAGPALQANAAGDSPIAVRVSVGYQNFYDPSVWVPVQVTVTGNRHETAGGRGVAGAGLIQFHLLGGGSDPYDGTLSWPFRMPASGTAVITVGLPGAAIKSGGRLRVMWNGAMLGSPALVGVAEQGTELAGVVSDRVQSVQFLSGVSDARGVSQLVAPYIPPRELPASSELLAGLTYLYIDGRAAAELSGRQVRAVLSWVDAGGILILGGLEPNAGQENGFSAVSPVAPQIVVDEPASSFGTFAGTVAPRGSLPLLFGKPRPGADVLIGEKAGALVATRGYGRGRIVYLGADAASSALVSWLGNAQFWDNLLHGQSKLVLPARMDLFGPSGAWTLMNAADQFPQLHAPPLYLWEAVFGAYILMAGPVSYLWLRRRRKNEWAWVYLPAIAVALSAGVYVAGVMQRPDGILTQSVGIVDITGPTQAEVVGVQALMSPQTRSYSVSAAPGTWMTALAERNGDLPDDGQVLYSGDGTRLAFHDVRAWGGRFAYAARTAHDFGAVLGRVFASNGMVGGYLTNDTKVSLSSVVLVVDGRVVPLGPLPVGKTVRVDFTESASRLPPLAVQLAAALTGSSRGGGGRAMFSYAASLATSAPPAGTLLLIGWSRREPRLFRADGPLYPASPHWLIRQVVSVTSVVE